jgi:hypothetical protein
MQQSNIDGLGLTTLTEDNDVEAARNAAKNNAPYCRIYITTPKHNWADVA